MKRFIFILLIAIGIGNAVSAQNFSSLNEVKFVDTEMYEEYIDQVFDCCYYLVQTPFTKKDAERVAANEFIKRWVKGSPSYTVKVSDKVKQLFEEREELISLYYGCYLKVSLEQDETNAQIIEEKALDSIIRYCENSSNKLKMTKGMKELSELKSNGDIQSIDEYFAMKG